MQTLQQELNNQQLHATSEQLTYQSQLNKWSNRDQDFIQFQEKYDAQITEMIQKQEENIDKRWNEKSDQITRDINLQIKQQLLLDYNLYMSIKENEIKGEQVSGPDLLQQQIIIQDNKKQLDLLRKQLDNSSIKTQKQQKYEAIEQTLNLIQQQLNEDLDTSSYQIAERNRKFQKELINIKIEIDSIEKAIELEYLATKLKRDNLNLQNKSQTLFLEYQRLIDAQILKLQQLQKQNDHSSTETLYIMYFNDKIEKLNKQKQNINNKLQSLIQGFQNQQIENLLQSFQKLKLFYSNLNNIISFEEQSTLQLSSYERVNQTQSLPNLNQKLQDQINQQLDLLDLISYSQQTQIYCIVIKQKYNIQSKQIEENLI